jgi:group II intron reverse transcriptase/maturase
MGVERRDGVIGAGVMGQPGNRKEPEKSAKSFEISKHVVLEAYQRVKANRGAAGIDNESIAMFEANLKGNLYRIWNRMSSGSYFPPAVRQVEIAKKNGGTRILGVPTVADRVAQMVAKLYVEPQLEGLFHSDSYGYRPGKSAKQAITRQRCWKYDWVVEFDVKGAFDNLDHDLLIKALRAHIKDRWILLYIKRWLTAPFETSTGELVPREKGTPQGGVVSPVLMNLFMHFAFDLWMQRSHPQCPFARYADDAVAHCRSQAEAERLLAAIGARLEHCKLTMHPTKSKVVYCKDSNRRSDYPSVQFTFLGFSFRPRMAENRHGQLFTGFLPAVSREALVRMTRTVRAWRLSRQTSQTIEEISVRYSPVLRGWWNYYGSFYPSALQRVSYHLRRKLALWARRRFKRLAGHLRASYRWLDRLAHRQPRLFVPWYSSVLFRDSMMGAV